MDLIDKKLLCELDLNCRKPLSQIAKKLRVSRNVIGYRIKNLEKEGIIKKYICSINLGSLGYKTYKIDLELQAITDTDEKRITDFFLTHPIVIHCLRTEGVFSYSLTIAVKKIIELDNFLTEMKNTFKDLIKDYHISIVVYSKIFKLNKVLLDQEQKLPKFHQYASEESSIPFDEKDKKIIKALSQEGNLSLIELTKRTGLTLDIVKYRLRQIEKTINPSFRIMLDFNKLDYYHYVILLKIRQASAVEEEKLVNYCLFKKNIIYCTKRIGYYDFVINVVIKDIEELNSFTKEIKKEFSAIIDSYALILNTELIKLNYIPF